MLYCVGIYSFFCELDGCTWRQYFPSLAIQFDITLLCCITKFDYCIREVYMSNNTSLHFTKQCCCTWQQREDILRAAQFASLLRPHLEHRKSCFRWHKINILTAAEHKFNSYSCKNTLYVLCKKPNSTWPVTSRHDTHDMSCVSRAHLPTCLLPITVIFLRKLPI